LEQKRNRLVGVDRSPLDNELLLALDFVFANLIVIFVVSPVFYQARAVTWLVKLLLVVGIHGSDYVSCSIQWIPLDKWLVLRQKVANMGLHCTAASVPRKEIQRFFIASPEHLALSFLVVGRVENRYSLHFKGVPYVLYHRLDFPDTVDVSYSTVIWH